MGERITIDGDGEHPWATPTDRGYWESFARYKLVEKTSSEVGAGTAWPMLVTWPQLMEIVYRVKDAWFTAGSVETSPGGDPSSGLGLSMTGYDPPSQLITGDGETEFYIRGYCWWGSFYDLHVDDRLYFGTAYGPDILPKEYPFPTEYLAEFFPPTVHPWASELESLYRDAASNERLIWLPDSQDLDSLSEETAKINGATMRTAFSHEISDSNQAYVDHPAPSQLRLEIYPEVAWVDENESGNPFDPANTLYLKLRFGLLGTAGPYDVVALDSMPDSEFRSFTEATDLVFQLANSTCSAKLYFYNEYDGEDAAIFASASPFVVTAKSWWPYATKAGVDAWSPTTGAPANGGPAA
jgi:hypothetical protein